MSNVIVGAAAFLGGILLGPSMRWIGDRIWPHTVTIQHCTCVTCERGRLP